MHTHTCLHTHLYIHTHTHKCLGKIATVTRILYIQRIDIAQSILHALVLFWIPAVEVEVQFCYLIEGIEREGFYLLKPSIPRTFPFLLEAALEGVALALNFLPHASAATPLLLARRIRRRL